MPTIDGTKVVENSARCFRAFGGGWGIKMKLPGQGNRELTFGSVGERERADAIVDYLNSLAREKRTSSQVMEWKPTKEEAIK